MKVSLLFVFFMLLLSGCNDKSNSISPLSAETAIESTVEESNPTAENIDPDDIICTAIKNYLLGKSEAAILTPTAREDLTESTWPEVQCSVDGVLDSPKSFNELTVKKDGNGNYKVSAQSAIFAPNYINMSASARIMAIDSLTIVPFMQLYRMMES